MQLRMGHDRRRTVIARPCEIEFTETVAGAGDVPHRTRTGPNPADDIRPELRTPQGEFT